MASIFGHTNPLATQVGQRIDQATDASLPNEDWSRNISVCDIINESDEGPKEAIKAIRKKIQLNTGKNYKVILYCLTLLESCVKNCGKRFHIQVANKDFLHELIKIIGPKNDPPQAVQEKVLSLIQTWADAFRHIPELKEIDKVYQDLKAKGIEFPMTDLDSMAPIHTPAGVQPQLPYGLHHPAPVVYSSQVLPSHNSPAHVQSMKQPTGQQLGKLKTELTIVNGNIRVFSEMLTDLSPTTIDTSDLELMQELNRTLRNMQQRIVQLIDSIGNEDVTVELLMLNDTLNNVFLRYDRFERYRTTLSQSPSFSNEPTAVVNDAPPPPYDMISEQSDPNVGNLIDFDDSNGVSSQLGQLSMSAHPKTSEPTPIVTASNDDFDMFAQSRQSFDASKQSLIATNQVYQNQRVDEVQGGLGRAVNVKSNTQMTDKEILDLQDAETDYDEMEQWLKVNDPNYGGTQHQIPTVTSSEFDDFLSQRSHINEVPEITSRNTPQNRHIKKEDDDANALFAL